MDALITPQEKEELRLQLVAAGYPQPEQMIKYAQLFWTDEIKSPQTILQVPDFDLKDGVRLLVRFAKDNLDGSWHMSKVLAFARYESCQQPLGWGEIKWTYTPEKNLLPRRSTILDELNHALDIRKRRESLRDYTFLRQEFQDMGFANSSEMIAQARYHAYTTFLRTTQPAAETFGNERDLFQFDFVVAHPRSSQVPYIAKVQAMVVLTGPDAEKIMKNSRRVFDRVDGRFPTADQMKAQLLERLEMKHDVFDRLRELIRKGQLPAQIHLISFDTLAPGKRIRSGPF